MRHLRQLILKHFSGTLPEDRQQVLRAHLRQCAACRQEYDRMALVLRVAAGSEPTRLELAGWQQRIWSRLQGPSEPARVPLGQRLAGYLKPALKPALAASLVFLLAQGVWLLRPEVQVPAVQMRGQAEPTQPALELEVFAIRQDQSGAGPRVRRLADGDSVGLGSYIQFSCRSLSPELKQIYLLGLDHRLQPLDYFPRPDQPQPQSLPLEGKFSPRSIRLARRHKPGPLWIIGLFSERPLARETVHQWIRELTLRGVKNADSGTILLGPGAHAVFKRVWLVHE